ncbi:hypothetical protein [Neolewinella agarilytica]|uniref:Uncharacterized protein n=1 Tax=Neolewinella agarilytica TaxID=478744 RepID=A0A1H9JD94_9BACT|nr:hypothetical protein [Neolewinella agarilytica]SEQ84802.1 hypothetical protein SAMN05444359_11714 [Neolewinella agarilytica]
MKKKQKTLAVPVSYREMRGQKPKTEKLAARFVRCFTALGLLTLFVKRKLL